ncbi:hypothetical protein [Vineibacter terrae]|uniref:hypothetical protein n=1 Tax=Vineibacter terrae TaxID=2586908 RepID=UPI002E2FA3F5|nr:hypothetical protein [Vineibacter terrae]HEX2888596.1 hypothetical protein [Vineibacter terrae]
MPKTARIPENMAMAHVTEAAGHSRWARIGATLAHEFREVLPPTIFFFIGFNLVLFTKRLFLADYLIQVSGFLVATTGALIVGKVVLVADKMPFLRRYDDAPLIRPILFKTIVYTMLVFIARLLEAFVHYVAQGGAVGGGGFIDDTLGSFSWYRFSATQIWIFVLFLIYVTAVELNTLLGDGELFKIFFTRRSSELKSSRRARIRLLVRLSRLIDAHPIEALGTAGTKPHAELTAILRAMAQGDRSTSPRPATAPGAGA